MADRTGLQFTLDLTGVDSADAKGGETEMQVHEAIQHAA